MSKIVIQKINKEPVVRFNGEEMVLPTKLQKKIEAHWEELLDSGREYFNGEVFNFKRLEQISDELEITIQRTNFAHFLYTRNIERRLGKYRLRTVFSACLILTKDNKIIFGKMGEHTSLAGRYQLVGGGLDNNDLEENIFDMKHSATKELGEELGVDASDRSVVKKFKVAYLKTGGSEDVAIIYKVIFKKTTQEFLEHYKKFAKDLQENGETPEFSEIVALAQNKKAVKEFIGENKDKMANYLPAVLQQIIEDK
jgi:8-oxo-dGTP pyrophosphatase MutT (NUDIX family)